MFCNRFAASLCTVLGTWCWLLSFASTGLAAEFLVISDIHFNPMGQLSKSQFQTLHDLPADQWGNFLIQLAPQPNGLGQDSNYALMTSALDAAQKRLPEPAFVLYPGDFLAHDWQATYDKLAPQTIAENPEAFRQFTNKALMVISAEFEKRFPRTPILATLGNDDSYCGDYWIQPGGSFLKAFAETWRPRLGDPATQASFDETFPRLGAYRADLPGFAQDRLLVLNSVLWSGSYCCAYHAPGNQNCCECSNPGTQPGRELMAWFKQELAQAKLDGKRIWLLMHVPPGLDSYVEEKSSGKSKAAEMWTDEFITRYLALIDEYRDILHVSFTGHTHMDDYRIDQIDGEPVLLHKISPAVSPIFGNNAAFQVFHTADDSSLITHWECHMLNLASLPKAPLPAWRQEYDSRRTYGLEEVTARSMTALLQKMRANPTEEHATAYRQFYTVSASTISTKDLPIYLCTVLNSTFEAFTRCLKSHGLEKPTHVAEPAELRRNAGKIASSASP